MPAAAPRSPGSWAFRLACVGMIAATAWLYAWILGQNTRSAYYLPLTDGYTVQLARGHAALAVAPDPRLIAAANPYDPAQAQSAHALFDASYYRGRYYSYFGIVPFAELLVPAYWITGRVIPVDTAVGVYAFASFLAAAATLLVLMGRYGTGRGSHGIALLGLAVLGWGTPTLLLLRRPEIYELEIAAGWAHGALGILLATLALLEPRRRHGYLAAASLAFALGVGCRPHYVAVVAASLGLLYLAWKGAEEGRGRLRLLLALVLPAALVGLALAWFNWVRFDNPLEFGFRYQLVSYNRQSVGFMSPRNIPYNLYLYLLGGARLSPYFPWFLGEAPGPIRLPEGHEATDQVYGCLLYAPVLWALGVLPLLRRGRREAAHASILALGVAGASLAFFSLMGNGAYRYLADYLPAALLATLAAVACSDWGAGARAWAARGIYGLLCLATIVASQAQHFALYDLFESAAPKAFARVGRVANLPVFVLRALQEARPGMPHFSVTFPSHAQGKVEPLLVLGEASQQDFLYVYYVQPGFVKLGFETSGAGGPLSASIPAAYGEPHDLAVFAGSLLPPGGDPSLEEYPAPIREGIRRRLMVLLDGRIALDAEVTLHKPKGYVFVGRSPSDAAFGERFTGILDPLQPYVLPGDLIRSLDTAAREDTVSVTLDVAGLPPNQNYPLFSYGYHPNGLVAYARRTPEDAVAIGFATGDVKGPAELLFPRGRVGATSLRVVLSPSPFETATLHPGANTAGARRLLKARVALGDASAVLSLDAPVASPASFAGAVNAPEVRGVAPTCPVPLNLSLSPSP